MRNNPHICNVYSCNNKPLGMTGYCQAHASPLRPGLPLYSVGSAPIIHRKFKNGVEVTKSVMTQDVKDIGDDFEIDLQEMVAAKTRGRTRCAMCQNYNCRCGRHESGASHE